MIVDGSVMRAFLVSARLLCATHGCHSAGTTLALNQRRFRVSHCPLRLGSLTRGGSAMIDQRPSLSIRKPLAAQPYQKGRRFAQAIPPNGRCAQRPADQ